MTSPSELKIRFGSGDYPSEVELIYLERCEEGHVYICGVYGQGGHIIDSTYHCPICHAITHHVHGGLG